MTGMLASVRCVDEAAIMLQMGVDILDLKDPGAGALGALSPPTLRDIVRLVNGRVTVSATVGDLRYESKILRRAVETTARCGVDIVKVGVFGDPGEHGPLQGLAELCRSGVRIVLVLFAELYGRRPDFHAIAGAGIYGIMLDTRDKDGGGLTAKLNRPRLEEFVANARTAGLLSGLAGALTVADIAELRSVGPDYLGFRGALCRQGNRGNELDPVAARRIRSLLKTKPGTE